MRWAASVASAGNSSKRHSSASTPRVRGAAFLGVLRLAGARLRFAVAALVLAALLVAMRELRKERREHTRAPNVNLGRVFTIQCLLEVPMRNGALHSPIRNLRKDLRNVARDAEELLRATADVTNDRVQE